MSVSDSLRSPPSKPEGEKNYIKLWFIFFGDNLLLFSFWCILGHPNVQSSTPQVYILYEDPVFFPSLKPETHEGTIILTQVQKISAQLPTFQTILKGRPP